MAQGNRARQRPGRSEWWRLQDRHAGYPHPKSRSSPSLDLWAAGGRPAGAAAGPAATTGPGQAGLGAQGEAEPRRLPSDGVGLGVHSRWLPLCLDGQEGGQVEIQHGRPSARRGCALATLRAGNPALLVGGRVQPPHARLAEGVATVEAAGQVLGEVVGRIADNAVSPRDPSGRRLLMPLDCSILREARGELQSTPPGSATAVLCDPGLAPGAHPEDRTPASADLGGGQWGQQKPELGHSLGSRSCRLGSRPVQPFDPPLPVDPWLSPTPASLSPRLLLPASAPPLAGYAQPEGDQSRWGGPGRPTASSLGLALLAEPESAGRQVVAPGGQVPLSTTKHLQLDPLHYQHGRR